MYQNIEELLSKLKTGEEKIVICINSYRRQNEKRKKFIKGKSYRALNFTKHRYSYLFHYTWRIYYCKNKYLSMDDEYFNRHFIVFA